MLAIQLIAAVSWILVGGLVFAVALAVLQRWPLATRVSRGVALGAAANIGALLLLIVILMVEPEFAVAVLPDSPDPALKARALAELIATLMNCGALTVLVGLFAVPMWFFTRRRALHANG